MKRVNAIIEARMGSSRLPGKTMMEILGKPSIELLMERLRRARRITDIVMATTVNAEDDVIAAFCLDYGVKCFRGSSEDVLARVYHAAREHRTDVIVEVTGDCPLLDPWLIDACIDVFLKADYDYLSNFIEQSYPPGIDVQIFAFAALERMHRAAKEAKFREHVTLYILKNPELFKMHNVYAPPELHYPDWHLELDEYADYELIKAIYEHLYPKNPAFTTMDIIGLLKEHPEWLELNRQVKRTWEQARGEDVGSK
ncbi:MAG TPA: glycosyltransferase family protein [Syntrophales bacterium]|nr:glycosyltransferase family protein [Syntrophales bacterium]HOD97275.1 glycosyltransferase family protein [Syntrophales bacterium]HOH72019.1 glycosyltransferase family protein [Syntrophales bacterium]HPN07802.1 glycosyltransferase family protein [Syntrophales bacterium]HPX80270.1 glycosyltransferase family protein [Syntrophales bacterium]